MYFDLNKEMDYSKFGKMQVHEPMMVLQVFEYDEFYAISEEAYRELFGMSYQITRVDGNTLVKVTMDMINKIKKEHPDIEVKIINKHSTEYINDLKKDNIINDLKNNKNDYKIEDEFQNKL